MRRIYFFISILFILLFNNSCSKEFSFTTEDRIKQRNDLEINTVAVDQLLNDIDYSKISIINGIIKIENAEIAKNIDNLLDKAYIEYNKAINEWYENYKNQYLSENPIDTVEIELKMQNINWYYVSDNFINRFSNFRSLENKYKDLEIEWRRSNLENETCDPSQIKVKDKNTRIVMNIFGELIIGNTFYKAYEDGTQIKLINFNDRQIELLKDQSNISNIKDVTITNRGNCDYWTEEKEPYEYSLCYDNYSFRYEAGVYTGISLNGDISQYWGDANLWRKNIFGGLAWLVKADWMTDVLSGTVYIWPKIPISEAGTYEECTCELNVQSGIVSGCPNFNNYYPGPLWTNSYWQKKDTNCSGIEVEVESLLQLSHFLVFSVTYDQLCATFGFSHTRIKKGCTENKTVTGLKVCVK